MTNKLLFPLNFLLLIGIGVLYYLHFLNPTDFVYVDASKLMANYKGMAEAQTIYKNKIVIWEANLDTLRNELHMEVEKYNQELGSFSAKEKELTEELIRTKKKQLADYQAAISEKAKQEDTQMTNHVLGKVNDYIKVYGEQKGYKIIFAATHYGNIAYAEKGIDITDDVLNGLNKEYVGR